MFYTMFSDNTLSMGYKQKARRDHMVEEIINSDGKFHILPMRKVGLGEII